MCGDGGGDGEHAAALSFVNRDKVFGEADGTHDIDAHEEVEIAACGVDGFALPPDACVGECGIDTAVLLERGLHERGDSGVVGHIAVDECYIVAGVEQFLLECLAFVLLD